MKSLFAIVLLSTQMLIGSTVLADDNNITSVYNDIKQVAAPTVTQDSAILIIGASIKLILSILGIVMLIILVYAGFKWITSEGEVAKVQKAKAMINTAVIGLIVTLSAYAITYFVVESLKRITGVQ